MYVLENAAVRFEIDRDGAVISATDKTDGTVHARGGEKIFRLIVPGNGFDSRAVDSTGQGPTGQQDGNVLRLRYQGLTTHDYGEDLKLDITAEVTYALYGDDPVLDLSMTLTNDCPDRIVEVQFPIIGNWTGYGGKGVDKAMAPVQRAHRMPDPHVPQLTDEPLNYTLLESRARWTAMYPLDLAAPWVDISGADHGIGVINLMTTPQLGGALIRDASGHQRTSQLEIGWFNLTGIKQGATLELPSAAVYLHRGDWHETAKLYRERIASWWTPAPLPERLQTALGFENIVVQDFDGITYRTWGELADETIASTTTGTRDVSLWDYLLLGLYHRRDERGLHEYTPDEERQIKAATAKLKEHGHLSHTLTNMRLALPQGKWWDEVGHKAALRLDDYTLRTEAYSCSTASARYWTPWRGAKSVLLCAGSEEFREHARDNVQWLMDMGFRAIHVDQPFERYPCSSPDHAHGDEGDTHAQTVDWVREVKEVVAAQEGDSYLIGEFVDPWIAQHIEVLWNWGWSKSQTDAVAYSLPGITPAWIVDRDHQDALNGFLRGFLLSFVTRGTTGSLSKEAEFTNWISPIAALRERTADFTLNAIFADQDGIEVSGGVEARRFVDGRGDSEGITVVNRGDQSANATITLTGNSGSVARWHGTDGSVGDWVQLTDGGGTLTSTLGALDAGVWEIRKSA